MGSGLPRDIQVLARATDASDTPSFLDTHFLGDFSQEPMVDQVVPDTRQTRMFWRF